MTRIYIKIFRQAVFSRESECYGRAQKEEVNMEEE